MAIQSLDLDLSEIRSRVAFKLHGVRDYSLLNSQDQANIGSVIKSGLRRFYYPQMTDPALNHRWSFLKPEFVLDINSANRDYTLDPRIGGVIDIGSYRDSDQAYIPVHHVSVVQIQQLRSRATQVSTFPTIYATRWVAADGDNTQRLQMLLYPDPDANYRMFFRARVRPEAITDDHPVPWGGPECAEAILQSCLAVAEQQIDGELGVETAAFRAALSAAIQFDQANCVETGENMGMMLDGYYGTGYTPDIRMNGRPYFENFSAVTYNGQN
jgi:hypothetical protein